jgi:hypothetical protein
MADEHAARAPHRLERFDQCPVAAANRVGGDNARIGGERLSRQSARRSVDAESFATISVRLRGSPISWR